MLATVTSAALIGLDAVPIEVEVDIASQGLPSFTIVGLPDKAVEEAKERVRSALRNSGADFPARRITVNLAPADLPKEGPAYDLPIAIGILIASGQLKADVSDALFAGELALDGRLRPIKGALPISLLAKKEGIIRVFLPEANEHEATVIETLQVFPLPTLVSLFRHLSGQTLIQQAPHRTLDAFVTDHDFDADMQDIRGQHQAKRALEIAAAGGHNLLMKGPPGAGKTLLARTLPSILPRLTLDEALEVTKIYSISGLLTSGISIKRPFRAPHHSTSLVGLIGGSSIPRPGEITLAHRGVLFLDEFPEFPRHLLESLRQPIEDGVVAIARANGRITFPAKCMLVAAQNPCPCGYLGDKSHLCSCQPGQIVRYKKKISGPLLDRIDIHLDVPAIQIDKLTDAHHADSSENSKTIRVRVQHARDRQEKRFMDFPIMTNAEMTSKMVQNLCPLTADAQQLLTQAVTKLHLSGRSYFRTIKLSRTIADLTDCDDILPEHIAEALQYRPKLDLL